MAKNTQSIVAGAALGACVGALIGWFLAGSQRSGRGPTSRVRALDRGRALGILWAVIGVIRLISELDDA